MPRGSTITSIIIGSMRTLSLISWNKNGEGIDIMSGHVAFRRVHGSLTDMAQRMGDEFRFWVPRALNDVGWP